MFGKLSKGQRITQSAVKSRIIDLEGYKYFFFPVVKYNSMRNGSFSSIIPPIFFPIFLLPFFVIVVISIPLKFDFTMTELFGLIFACALPMYLIAITFYFSKINSALKKCETITTDEKKWIFDNIFTDTFDDKNDVVEIDDEIRKKVKKQSEERAVLSGILFSLLLIFSFSLMLIQGLTTGYIDVSYKKMYHIISYEQEANQFVFSILFLSISILYFFYTLYKNFKPFIKIIREKLSWENISSVFFETKKSSKTYFDFQEIDDNSLYTKNRSNTTSRDKTKLTFKWRYVFFVTAFFLITFPLWFFIYAMFL